MLQCFCDLRPTQLLLISPASELPCVAVCCRVLQCVTLCCSVLQCVAVCCHMLPCVAMSCRVLKCIAVHCSALQCIAVHCSALQCVAVLSGGESQLSFPLYRVAKTHRMPYFYESFSAKEPYD